MSYRPSSARRQQTSINPITGEKIDYSKKAHFIKDQTTPIIPSLDLSNVNDSDRQPPHSAKQYHGSARPGSAHGGVNARLGSHRPESRAYGNFDHQQAIYTNRHGNLLQNTHYDLNPDRVPAMDIQIVPPPPLPRPVSSRTQRALSTRLPDSVRPAIILDGNAALTPRGPFVSSVNSPIDEFQLAWLESGNHQDSLTKVAAEEKNEQRKHELMTEQVLSDQLSRYVLSDLEQEDDRHKPIIIQQQPRRNLDRRMHDTKVKTSTSLTENLLSKRIRFSCRILTRDGKDALRDLFGFYFMLDRTLAIYEYRILGKRSNALPLIPRGQYVHLSGYNQGQPYTLLDFYQEARIDFETRSIMSLPETVRHRTKLTICIVSINEEEKQTLLLDGVQDMKRREIVYAIKHPYSTEQLEHQRYLADVHQLSIPQIKQRAVIVYTSLAQFYRKRANMNYNEEKDSICICEKEDLLSGLHEYRIHLSAGHFAYIWSHMSIQGEANEFLNLLFGELNEKRFAQVIKAYSKLDPLKTGYTDMDSMKKFVNLYGHPYAIQNCLSDEKLWTRFCDTFRFALHYPRVSYSEFLNVYEGLNLSVDQDDDFIHLVNNTWNI
ncbi:unnamed protein product [Rotaria sp. Silwood1]|nr:unnamed protein product [Rotaria sp. Silwood1]CAF3369193.1 unnamed protein product [Rotaria sp. Silwood1]CAF3400143.1 unnamed protein product [Rotaria sp. Silwood1]CAF4607138.1 unnamed protein product [Rotaria sp. Silwood1]CAF4778736.1 unnamed protein product [Rotaria sp. Silwood1]